MLCVAWEHLRKGGLTLHGSVAITEYLRLITLKEKRFSLTCGSGALEAVEGPMLFVAQQEVGACLNVVNAADGLLQKDLF